MFDTPRDRLVLEASITASAQLALFCMDAKAFPDDTVVYLQLKQLENLKALVLLTLEKRFPRRK